jgi:hypothetical protein
LYFRSSIEGKQGPTHLEIQHQTLFCLFSDSISHFVAHLVVLFFVRSQNVKEYLEALVSFEQPPHRIRFFLSVYFFYFHFLIFWFRSFSKKLKLRARIVVDIYPQIKVKIRWMNESVMSVWVCVAILFSFYFCGLLCSSSIFWGGGS